jgi:trigger factor
MVKQYYGEGVFYDDAIDFAVNPAYAEAIREHDLKVVSKPELDILEIGAEKGLKFTITVTIKPEVKLGDYMGVKAPFHSMMRPKRT